MHRDNDQQNHWVPWATQHFQTFHHLQEGHHLASGLQMSINLGISGIICMHASRQGNSRCSVGIAHLAKSNPSCLGKPVGKNHGKTWGKSGSFCVQPCLQMDGLLQQSTYVLDPLVRLVQYPSINPGFSTKITQIGKKTPQNLGNSEYNLTCRGRNPCFPDLSS